MKISIKYGGNSIILTIPAGSNLDCIRSNTQYASVLGLSDFSDVDLVLNGTIVGGTATLSEGDVIVVQPKAHEKASA